MFIKQVVWRHRNDFHFIAKCEHCGHEHRRGDGYANEFFCLEVVPGQACPRCGKNSHGEQVREPALGDSP